MFSPVPAGHLRKEAEGRRLGSTVQTLDLAVNSASARGYLTTPDLSTFFFAMGGAAGLSGGASLSAKNTPPPPTLRSSNITWWLPAIRFF